MEGLLGRHDVEQTGGADAAGAVAHGGQVGRRVAVAAVGLAHDERERLTLAVLEALGEHAQCPVVLHQQALLVELGDDDGQQRVVEALPDDVVGGEEDAEQLVDLAGVAHGLVDEDAPEVQRLVVAGLEQHDAVAAALGEGGVAVELPAGRGVELVEVAHAEGLGVGRPVHVEQVLNEHAERRAPVADVVLAPHVVTEEPEHAGQGVPDERAAQVADVHLLGHVGRRVVDDHGLGVRHRLDAQPLVGGQLPPPGRRRSSSDSVRLMKPGPLTSTSAQMSSREAAATTSSATWRGGRPTTLRQGQGAVGLEVGPVRGPQHRVGAGRNGVEGGLQPLEEDAGGVGHPSFSHARRAVNRAAAEPGRRTPQSAGAPMPPSSKP